ncbi:CGCGG family rSAM-modified RiPP protein [Halomicroarcula sp. GCM10025324]|uniref:CGCGG family putative rSAM-modified RiPP protein n=1 Tax=Haloarcula TaxID=2237 RepID=UPI0023E8E389|nr:CGCGG family rSAM-modified RiPP protein [Halomicroarcula sp. ZS-22-S1]
MFATRLWPLALQGPPMGLTDDDVSVTDHVHENSWSANLETADHAEDRALVTEGAVDAVAKTAPGHHVNLVTHAAHGHPESYLFPVLDERFGARIEYDYVQQCGCGGHVTRVQVD